MDSRYNKLLGPSEITLLYRNFAIPGLQKQLNTKNVDFGTKKISLLYRDFVIPCVLSNKSPLYYKLH